MAYIADTNYGLLLVDAWGLSDTPNNRGTWNRPEAIPEELSDWYYDNYCG